MSEKDACPDGSLECEVPSPIQCSFKGCEPLQKHDQSYNVRYHGQRGRTLRDFTSSAICAGRKETSFQLSNLLQQKIWIELRTGSCLEGVIFKTVSRGYVTYTQMGSEKGMCDVKYEANLNDASCFKLYFGICGPDSVSVEAVETPGLSINLLNSSCSKIYPQCMKMTIQENVKAKSMFLLSKEEPKFMAKNKIEFEALLGKSIKDKVEKQFEFLPYVSIQCMKNQSWRFLDPRLR